MSSPSPTYARPGTGAAAGSNKLARRRSSATASASASSLSSDTKAKPATKDLMSQQQLSHLGDLDSTPNPNTSADASPEARINNHYSSPFTRDKQGGDIRNAGLTRKGSISRMQSSNSVAPSPSPKLSPSTPFAIASSATPPSSHRALPSPSLTATSLGGTAAVASRPRRGRAASSFTPLPPVMSRENSSEKVHQHQPQQPLLADTPSRASSSITPQSLIARLADSQSEDSFADWPEAGPSRPRGTPTSDPRPPRSNAAGLHRAASYSTLPASTNKQPEVSLTPQQQKRKGLKRRISTPGQAPSQFLEPLPESTVSASVRASPKPAAVKIESRGRSTSTSVVVPQTLDTASPPIIPVQTMPAAPVPLSGSTSAWQPTSPPAEWDNGDAEPSSRTVRFLTSAYTAGESSVRRLASLVSPHRTDLSSQVPGSSDSEKGIADGDAASIHSAYTRSSEDSTRSSSRSSFWGLWKSQETDSTDGADGYFSLPPTPPLEDEEKPALSLTEFEAALASAHGTRAEERYPSLPTPALSTRSLSRRDGRTGGGRSASPASGRGGWLKAVFMKWGSGKTGEVIRELGWTVGGLVALFFVTLGIAFWMIRSLPITTLKHLPSSTTDLQLLSAEIRAYMASGAKGWWHTIAVLVFAGCWKHAWSVPGAVILNVLVGSLLEPMPALLLLTLITATGSLGSYMLSRPLAPLISVLFPKPLALVRAALAPESVPAPPTSSNSAIGLRITPVHVSEDPAAPAVGADGASPTGSSAIWRRLLIMRSMGIVPWSGMNVACGVVGVDWKIFWLTTAAGSASWSYVTASVGNILSRLAIPASAAAAAAAGSAVSGDMDAVPQGESIASLLRDPVLIAKLVFLTGLTLVPVFFKRGSSASSTVSTTSEDHSARSSLGDVDASLMGEKPTAIPFRLDTSRRAAAAASLSSPTTPLTTSLARFAPTPAAFDLLSFGRTVTRQGIAAVTVTAGAAANGVRSALGRA